MVPLLDFPPRSAGDPSGAYFRRTALMPMPRSACTDAHDECIPPRGSGAVRGEAIRMAGMRCMAIGMLWFESCPGSTVTESDDGPEILA